MKAIFKIVLFMLMGIAAKAQLPSSTFRSRIFTGNTEAQWLILDSPLVNFVGPSLFNARYPGTQFVKIGGGDTAFYFGAGGNLWFRSLLDRDTISLSNRINLKLNITDTTNRWWGLGKRWVDTVYRVNDSTIGYTINGGAQQTFQILGRLPSGGGAGTVTSVGLSMPSAFNVTPSTITTSGIFNVTMPGLSTQYVRANGTVATTDTGMIPNFYLKVRGLISGASPITFNQTTGAIGIPNANNTGQKGAATFNNTDFIDNGAGLISLRNPSAFPGVDTIWRTPGIDSIYFKINSVQYAILDSAGATVTANNGLTKTSNNIQLGGALIQSTAITSAAGASRITYSGVSALGDGAQLDVSTTGSVGIAVKGSSTDGRGIFGTATTGVGVYGSATSSGGIGLFSTTTDGSAIYSTTNAAGLLFEGVSIPSSTNTVIPVMSLTRSSQSAGANGIGGSIDMNLHTTLADRQSNRIVYKLTTATDASYASSMEFWNANSATVARKAALAGNGQWTWDGYPSLTAQTDTTTYKPVAIDGSGNVVKMIGWAGSGGGGSQTLQQVFNQGSILTKHDTIFQANYLLATDGQFINKDTNRMGESGVVLTFGVSTDLGLVTGPIQLPVNWPALVIGNIGYLNWNRAADGSTLNSYSGPSDSSFESKYPYIPNWDPSIRYIIIGNYVINEAIHGTDSTTMGTSMGKWIDSLIIHRGYPANRIIVLNGHRSPAVLAGHPLLPLLALATKNAAINKGVRYFDSYNYTLNNASYSYSDSIHLSIKGQINLAIGIMNSGDLDSLNYIQANNIHILKYLTNEGGSKLSGVFNSGNDSTVGRQYIGGNLNLQGNIENNTTFLKGVSITGDNTLGRVWNLYNGGGEQWGIQMGNQSGSFHTDIFAGSNIADSVRLGHKVSGTFITTLATAEAQTSIYSNLFHVKGGSIFDDSVALSKGLNVAGDQIKNRVWNLFANSSFHELWGMRMGGSDPYGVEIYGAWSNPADYVALGWMGSDGVTYHPVIRAFQSGIANISSLTAQNDTTTYKPLVVTSGGDIYKMVGWPTGGTATTIYNGDGTLSGNRTVTGSSNSLTFSGINQFRVYANYLYQAKTDGTRLYASAIDPSSTGSQAWQFGYSPFTRGVGLYVDTLNNVGLGDVTQTSMPLYTTGNSAYIRNGLQSQQGNFYSVTNVTTTSTLGVTVNFVTVDATSGNITITLPAASASFGSNMGLDIIFKRLDNSANTITISRAGADLIDGATTFTLTSQYQSKQIRAISSSAWAIY